MEYGYLVYNNDIEGIKKLMVTGWNSSINDNIHIRYASRHDRIEIIKLLITDRRVREKLTENDYIKYPFLKTLVRQYKIEALNL